MVTRASRAPTAVRDDTPPSSVAGPGTVDPISFAVIKRVTDRVFFVSVSEEVSDEQNRASRALEHHLDLIARTDGWRKIGAHEHPQLESEPDD